MLALNNLEQGSQEWFRVKLGVISASNISKVLAKKGTDTRAGYMAELVAQVCTSEFPEVNAKAMEWGKIHEAAARSLYEFNTGFKASKVGFIYGPGKRVGCSPDGLVQSIGRGVEIKAPFTTRVYIEFLCSGKIKNEYLNQVQFSMWVSGYESWDFVNYDPRMTKNPLHYQTIERDPVMMARFDEVVPEFVADMDAMLALAEYSWGDQWK